MKIINFEEAKKRLKGRDVKHLPDMDNWESELMKPYQELVQLCEKFYGEHKDINIKPIRILKHGRKAKSLVKYGLEEISTILMRPTYTPKFDVFKFL